MKIFTTLVFACACSLVHAQQSNPVEAIESVRLQLPTDVNYSFTTNATLIGLDDVRQNLSFTQVVRANGQVILDLLDPFNPPEMARLHLYVPGGTGIKSMISRPFALPKSRQGPVDAIDVNLRIPRIGIVVLSIPFDCLNKEQHTWLAEDPNPIFHFIRPMGSPHFDNSIAFPRRTRTLSFGPHLWGSSSSNATNLASTYPPYNFSVTKRNGEFSFDVGPMASGRWFVWVSGKPNWRTLPFEINVAPNVGIEWVLPAPVQEQKWHIQFPATLTTPVFPCLIWERVGDEPLFHKSADSGNTQAGTSWTNIGIHCKQLFLMQNFGGFGSGANRLYFWNLEMESMLENVDPKRDLHPSLDLREMVPEISCKLPHIDGEEFCWLNINRLGGLEELHPSFPREGIAQFIIGEKLKVELYGLPAGSYQLTRSKGIEQDDELDSVMIEIQ